MAVLSPTGPQDQVTPSEYNSPTRPIADAQAQIEILRRLAQIKDSGIIMGQVTREKFKLTLSSDYSQNPPGRHFEREAMLRQLDFAWPTLKGRKPTIYGVLVLHIALAVPLLQKGLFPENHDPVQNEK